MAAVAGLAASAPVADSASTAAAARARAPARHPCDIVFLPSGVLPARTCFHGTPYVAAKTSGSPGADAQRHGRQPSPSHEHRTATPRIEPAATGPQYRLSSESTAIVAEHVERSGRHRHRHREAAIALLPAGRRNRRGLHRPVDDRAPVDDPDRRSRSGDDPLDERHRRGLRVSRPRTASQSRRPRHGAPQTGTAGTAPAGARNATISPTCGVRPGSMLSRVPIVRVVPSSPR